MKKTLSFIIALLFCAACIPMHGAVRTSAAPNVEIALSDPSCMSSFTYSNNLLVQYSDGEEAVMMAVAGGDPFALLNVEGSLDISADTYKYVVVTYRVPNTNTSAANTTELFMCAGDIAVPTGGYSVQFAPTRGYKYRSQIVDMTGESYWQGKIHAIRFDAFTNANTWDAFYLASVTFCSDYASAQSAAVSAASAANGVADGFDEGTLASNSYRLDTYTRKLWKGGITFNESVLPLCGADGSVPPISLMYGIKKVISVRNATLGTEYRYGTDYVITADGKFQVMPGGAIPCTAYSNWYSASQPSNSSNWMPCRDGKYTYFSESGDIHSSQLAITYTHDETWSGFVPESKTDLLPKTCSKLQNKQHLSVVFFGDSVTVGCNASSFLNRAPQMPTWPDMTVAALKAKYGYSDISHVDTAVGGMQSDWGVQQTTSRVTAYNPDLVFIGFGTNDGTAGRTAADFKSNIETIINTVRASRPDCEFVIVSPLVPNPETLFYGVQESYLPVMQQIESEYTGVAFANVYSSFKDILTIKRYCDVTGNNVNHPNDFFVRIYTQTMMTALTPSDIAEARADAVRALNGYVSLSDYREAEQQQIITIIADGTAAINGAETESAVRAELSAAKILIDEVKTAAEYEAENLDYTKLRFGSAATLTTVNKLHNVSEALNQSAGVTTFASTGDDPYFRINYNAGSVSADLYKYITVVYKVPSTVTNTSSTQIFYTAGSATGESEARSVSFAPEKGGYTYKVLDLSSAQGWSGKIHGLRFDTFATFSAGDSFSLHSVYLFENANAASSYGAKTVGILTGNYSGMTEGVQFDTEAELSRLSSTGGVRQLGDVDANGITTIQDYTLLKKVIACGDNLNYDKDLADTNRDGTIGLKDLLLLKKHLSSVALLPKIDVPSADVSYSAAKAGALLEASGSTGSVTADLSDKEISNDCDYLSIVYLNDTGDNVTVTVTLMKNGTEISNSARQFTAPSSGNYQYETIDISAVDGDFDSLKINFEGSSLCLGALYVSETESGAEGSASAKAHSLDRMTGTYTPTAAQTVVPLNGTTTMATFSGQTSSSGDAYAFSSSLTFTLDRQPDGKFDRVTFEYISTTIARGVITYRVNGTTATDEFFLEPTSSIGSFRTLIPGYFRGERASDIVSVTLYPCCASATAFALKGIYTEDCDNYSGEIYLQNQNVKVGILLTMGGGISYYEQKNDNNPNYANLLNRYDVGRLIQQSYYGIDRAPYVLGLMGTSPWGYNPVQGGDGHNNPSQIVDLEVQNGAIYVKVRPMDWGHDGHITPSYMENWYTLYDNFVKVDNRFVDFSGYTHTVGWQELPAFYTVSALNNFYYYNGNSPWTGDSLVKRSDLIFWGETNNQAFNLKSTSEFWSAWCDNAGFGVGLYVPNVYTLHAGKFGYDGSPSPDAPSTNYVAPRRNMTLIVGKPLTFSYLIAAGDLNQIRNTFRDNRGLVNNYSLETYNQ